MDQEINRRIFLIPENQLREKFHVLRLKHPRTNTGVLCALSSSNDLFEIVHYKDEFSSWFIDDSVSEDGSLYFLSPLDPLFFILSYVSETRKYCPLDDILIDEEFRDVHYLTKCCSSAELANIFDSKESSGYKVFSYNSKRTLHWIHQKVKFLSSSIKSKRINMSDGSKVATLQTSNEETPEILQHYSCQIISDYLSEDLSRMLYNSLGLKLEEKPKPDENLQGNVKRLNTAVSPNDDYSKNFSMKSLEETKTPKLTAAQKQLAKVDKKGMKSISSFFQKKN